METTAAKTYRRYQVYLKDRQIESVQLVGTQLRSFTYPDTKRGLPKLYIVKAGSEVVHVGQTTQSIRTRLRHGLKAKGKGGDYGYMWSNLHEVEIMVWCFFNKDNKYAETVEGELAYLCRKRKGNWPKHQMEIHFHNALSDEVEVAGVIYKQSLQ